MVMPGEPPRVLYNFPMTSLKQISVNEFFGPTIQGEGPDVGKPCYFLRLQGCPVQCPGCDTAYTWDGSERGTLTGLEDLMGRVVSASVTHQGCGLVVSGGEPFIYYGTAAFHDFLRRARRHLPWVSLETSGYVGGKPLSFGDCDRFLRLFDTVAFSPKVTPCLTGPKSAWEYEQNVLPILDHFAAKERALALKFVVKAQEDLTAVDEFVESYEVRQRKLRVYVMPYGQEPAEILAACRWLVPQLADRGYILTPRLHAVLWGKMRGV